VADKPDLGFLQQAVLRHMKEITGALGPRAYSERMPGKGLWRTHHIVDEHPSVRLALVDRRLRMP
jgi:hypothetical protein